MAKPCPHCGKMPEARDANRLTWGSTPTPPGRSGVGVGVVGFTVEPWGLAFDMPKRPVPGLPLRVRATVPALRPDEV